MLLHEVYQHYPIRLIVRPGARCTARIDTRDIQSDFFGNTPDEARTKAHEFIDLVTALRSHRYVQLLSLGRLRR